MTSKLGYQEARKAFENGDIVFFSRGKKNIARRLITWFCGGPIYHAGIVFWATVDGSTRLMLAEGQPGGFRIINLGFYADRDMTVFRCPVDWAKISRSVIERTGTPYDFLDMALIGLHEKFGLPIPKKLTGTGEVCSVIVSKILRAAGLRDIGLMVSPQRLHDQLSTLRNPAFVVIK